MQSALPIPDPPPVTRADNFCFHMLLISPLNGSEHSGSDRVVEHRNASVHAREFSNAYKRSENGVLQAHIANVWRSQL